MYIQLDRTKLGAKREEMETKAKEILGDKSENQLVIDNPASLDSFVFDNGEVTVFQSSPIGDFAFSIALTDDQMMSIVRHMTAKAYALKEVLSLARSIQ